MSIYKSAVKRPVTTALIFVAIAIIGIFAATRLSIDLYPKIETNTIMVVTSYSGAGAEDIESTISRPIENTLNAVSNLKHIRSNSRDNVSIVFLEFESGTNMETAMNDVRDKLDLVSNALPDEANKPFLFKFSADDIPIMIISAQAGKSTDGLYKILDDNVVNRLARLEGVGNITITGAPIREINIYCNPQQLEAYHLTLEQISQAIRAENANVPIGTIDIGSTTSSIRMQGEFKNTREIANVVVGSYQGRNIYLSDVATVHDGNKERLEEAYVNEVRGGAIIVYKQSGANSVDISQQVKKELPKLAKQLPSDVHLQIVMDTSDNILHSIDSLTETIFITFLVVVLVILFFLGRWRATFIIVLTIPISLIASLIYLYATGNTLNVISMSALSIAIGMVVDDAIVVLENITTHIERGSYPKQAAVYATTEVALSVIASTLTMLAVFLPLTMISGMTGILFRQLGWVVSIVMIVSTVAALTLTPMLCSRMLKHKQRNGVLYNKVFSHINKGLNGLDFNYGRLLNYAVRHRTLVVIIAVALFGGSLLLMPYIKTEFMPENDGGELHGTIELPQSTNVTATRDFALKFSKMMREKYKEDISTFQFNVGQADDANSMAAFRSNGSNIISINVRLKEFNVRKHTTQEVAQFFRKELKAYPQIETVQIQTGYGAGAGSNSVDMEIYGYDFDKTDKIAEQFVAKMQKEPCCAEVKVSRRPPTNEFQVEFDENKLALYGLTKIGAANALRNAINGSLSSYFRESGEEYDVRVRLAPQFRRTIDEIYNIQIPSPRGNMVRLLDIGRIVKEKTPPTIERKDRERYIKISCVTAPKYAMSDVVTAGQNIMKSIEFPDGTFYRIGGNYETQQESFADLFSLMILIIILVFIVMAAEFESFSDPFVIMFSVPFAFTGVLLGLSLTHTPMGLMALVGAIMLIGIVVKNGIVLIDYTILCRQRGMGVIQSVVTAGRSRLRPVLMTTLTTVLGMLPMALGTGEGAELWRPMGMTVAFGLTISTLVTLVLIPTIYTIFSGIEIKRKRKKLRKRAKRKQWDRVHADTEILYNTRKHK